MLVTILSAIFVLGVLIFVHEFGHFIVAKMCGVGVLKFCVGFGPAIYRFRRGETTYQLSVIPLGGYVRMVGDLPDMITGAQPTDEAVRDKNSDSDSGLSPEDRALFADRSRWFVEKPLLHRSLIVVAGPLFNFLLAFVLVILSVSIYGESTANNEPIIGNIIVGSPAEVGGLQVGDHVDSINGTTIPDWESLAHTIRDGSSGDLLLKVTRAQQVLALNVTAEKKSVPTENGTTESVYLIGIGPSLIHQDVGLGRAAKIGALWTAHATIRTCEGLWGMISGEISPKELAGPIFILGEAGRQAKKGMEDLLSFMAILSVSLAVLNLLPIPVLDGGHLLFFLLEAILGPISVRKKEFAQQLGMILLLCLMVFAIKNDIGRHTETTPSGPSWDEVGASSKK